MRTDVNFMYVKWNVKLLRGLLMRKLNRNKKFLPPFYGWWSIQGHPSGSTRQLMGVIKRQSLVLRLRTVEEENIVEQETHMLYGLLHSFIQTFAFSFQLFFSPCLQKE